MSTYTVVVDKDPHPLDPRQEYENLCVMLCFDKEYDLGDTIGANPNLPTAFSGWDDLEDFLHKNRDIAVIKPLYLLDHSGLSISTSDFKDPWDSGQVGFIYLERHIWLEAVSKRRMTPALKKQALECLEAEVREYNAYLTGDVWYFSIAKDGNEVLSCAGIVSEKEAREAAAEAFNAEIRNGG